MELKEVLNVIREKFPSIWSNKDFMGWFEMVYPIISDDLESGERVEKNLSLITFAYHQYPSMKVGEKVGIGVAGDKIGEVAERFAELFNKYCRDEKIDALFDRLFEKAKWVAIQLEYDGKSYIWHFYIYDGDKIYGVNCKDGKLVEYKEYEINDDKVVTVNGKHKRLQYNLEISGKNAFKFIKWLYNHGYISGEMKKLCEDMVLNDFNLDTVSSSKTRGISLYFD